mgnify:CR=1 FL=1
MEESPKKSAREERLAEALRANLRRRKSQSRARAALDDEPEPEGDAEAGEKDG